MFTLIGHYLIHQGLKEEKRETFFFFVVHSIPFYIRIAERIALNRIKADEPGINEKRGG